MDSRYFVFISEGTVRHSVVKTSETGAAHHDIVADTGTRRTLTEVHRRDVSWWPANSSSVDSIIWVCAPVSGLGISSHQTCYYVNAQSVLIHIFVYG